MPLSQTHDTQTWIFFHMPFCITPYDIKIVFGTESEHLENAISFEGKIKEKSAEKATKLNVTIF